MAKLYCLCTHKKFSVFAFSQAQTSLSGGPTRACHLLLAYNLHVLALKVARHCPTVLRSYPTVNVLLSPFELVRARGLASN